MSRRNFSKPIRLFTGEEVAQILRISRAYAYRLMQRGVIPSIRLGRRVLVSQTSLLSLSRRTTNMPARINFHDTNQNCLDIYTNRNAIYPAM